MKAIISITLLVIACALGLLVGRTLRKESKEAGSTQIVSIKGVSDWKPATPKTANHRSPIFSQLDHDLSMSSGVTKWLYWLEAIEKAGLNDFPALYLKAGKDSQISRLVALRWIEKNPRHCFDTLVNWTRGGNSKPANDLSSTLFQEWVKKDPQAVVQAMTDEKSFLNYRMTVSGMLVEADPELGLKVMHEWRIDSYGPRQTGIAKWAANNPLHAAQYALAHPAGAATQMAMETIGKEWAKINPVEALNFAVSEGGSLRKDLGKSAIKAWAENDLDAAAEWVGAHKGMHASTLVEAWAKKDPSAALRWCESNLAGPGLSTAIAGVCKGVAEKDVTAAAAWVNEMNPSQAKGYAAAAIAEKWFPDYSARSPVAPELVQWLASLDSSSLNHVLKSASWRWAENDPKSMASFLASKQDQNIPTEIYGRVARELARRDPAAAMEWTGSLPENQKLNAGADAFSEWQRHQHEAAMKWWDALPKEDDRRSLFFKNTIQTIAYEANATHKLGLLDPNEWPAARQIIAGMSIPEDRKIRLLQSLQN